MFELGCVSFLLRVLFCARRMIMYLYDTLSYLWRRRDIENLKRLESGCRVARFYLCLWPTKSGMTVTPVSLLHTPGKVLKYFPSSAGYGVLSLSLFSALGGSVYNCQ